MGKIFPRKCFWFPRKYQFIDKLAVFSVLAVFLTSGVLMASFQKLWARKNIKIYDITGIVPVAADHFPPIKNAPAERRNCRGVLMEKILWSANIWSPPTGRVWEVRCLVCMIIVDHMFGNVYWRNSQSYCCDNRNYFSHFQKIKEKKL